MKAKQTLLALGLLAALQAVAAAQQSTNVTVSADTSKAQIQPTYPAIQYKLEDKKTAAEDRSKVVRLEGMSSQAWTTIATRRSDASVSQDARVHECKLYLCSLGHDPW